MLFKATLLSEANFTEGSEISIFSLDSSCAMRAERRSGQSLFAVSNMIPIFQHASLSLFAPVEVGKIVFFGSVRRCSLTVANHLGVTGDELWLDRTEQQGTQVIWRATKKHCESLDTWHCKTSRKSLTHSVLFVGGGLQRTSCWLQLEARVREYLQVTTLCYNTT